MNQLVEELKSLSSNATRSEFLERPAMSQLMALGPAGYPALRDVFLRDNHWAVKASLAYLVVTMAPISHSGVGKRLISLADDENAFVRATAAALYKREIGCGPREIFEALSNPDVNAIATQLRLIPSLNWMASADVAKLAANSLSVIEKGRPFVEPPAWDSMGGRTSYLDVSSIKSAGLRAVTLEHAMAERVFIRISDSFVISSVVVHKTLDLMMASLESDTGSDQERLGRKFRMTELLLQHQHPQGSDGKCKTYWACRERLFSACDKWAWTATDPNALYAIQSALTSIIRWDKSKSLLERIKEHHPNPELREMTGRNLGFYAEQLAGEAKAREDLRQQLEQIERENNVEHAVARVKPAYIPPSAPKPPVGESKPGPSRSGPWVIVGAVGLAVLIAAGVYYKTRARSLP